MIDQCGRDAKAAGLRVDEQPRDRKSPRLPLPRLDDRHEANRRGWLGMRPGQGSMHKSAGPAHQFGGDSGRRKRSLVSASPGPACLDERPERDRVGGSVEGPHVDRGGATFPAGRMQIERVEENVQEKKWQCEGSEEVTTRPTFAIAARKRS